LNIDLAAGAELETSSSKRQRNDAVGATNTKKANQSDSTRTDLEGGRTGLQAHGKEDRDPDRGPTMASGQTTNLDVVSSTSGSTTI
jgi:hypothetical protein